MVILISQKNGCVYSLDEDTLIYTPPLKSYDYSTDQNDYIEVDWDCLDYDAYFEASRCYKLLSAELITIPWN